MKEWRCFVAALALFSVAVSAEASPNYNDPVAMAGTLERYGDDFYIGDVELELGDDDVIGADYNRDGKKRPVVMELYEMIGTQVTIKGYRDKNKADENEVYVTEINGQYYPNPEVHH